MGGKKYGGGDVLHIERDWILLLSIFTLSIVFTVLYHVHFYTRVQGGAFYGNKNASEGNDVVLDEARLKRVSALLTEREQLPQAVAARLSRIVDPSR